MTAVFCLAQCKKDDDSSANCLVEDQSRFNYANFPLGSLSEYGFFIEEIKDQNPTEGIIPYDVITPLFSDYAHKYRFIYVPENVSAEYDGDHELLDFPNGTIMIKTFYYDHIQPEDISLIIETRLLYKVSGEWKFANYVWNDEQTEASFDLDGSYRELEFVNDFGTSIEVDYRIPSDVECLTCHKNTDIPIPIGLKPQNLNKAYEYSDGEMNQLQKWIELGILDNSLPSEIETVADWTDETASKLDRVRAYLDMNCAHCHKENSHCDYRSMRFAWEETGIDINLGICEEPADLIEPFQLFVVAPGNANKSMMYYRLNNTEPSERMPLMGRTVIHDEGIALIEQWINELQINCD